MNFPPDNRGASLRAALRAILAKAAYPVAVQVASLSPGHPCTVFSQNQDLPFGAASIIKLPVLICIAHLVEAGELSWDTLVPLTVSAPHGTGLLEYLRLGSALTIHDLCVLMMGVSDNMACNQVLNDIGMKRINEILRYYGYTATVVRRSMMDRITQARGIDNTVTTAETTDMLTRLFLGTLVSPAADKQILQYLHMNQLHDLLAWPLPGSVTLAGKTGGMPGSLLDAELVMAPGEIVYSLCMFTSGFERAVQAKQLMTETSEAVFSALSGIGK